MANIIVQGINQVSTSLSLNELVAFAPRYWNIADRVPGIEGKAFDVIEWYHAWAGAKTPEPTHMLVEAADEFQAKLPWNQLEHSVFLFEQAGKQLEKGFPIRLYVPDGSSACLNVKSVVKIYFLSNTSLGDEASFGFKNQVSPGDMKLNK